jgi:hypothetical protein
METLTDIQEQEGRLTMIKVSYGQVMNDVTEIECDVTQT